MESETVAVPREDLKLLIYMTMIGIGLMARRYNALTAAQIMDALGVPPLPAVDELISRSMDLMPNDFLSVEAATKLRDEMVEQHRSEHPPLAKGYEI
jgi:hypothetical protein